MFNIVALLLCIILLSYVTIAKDDAVEPTSIDPKQNPKDPKSIIKRDVKQEIAQTVNSYIASNKLYSTYAFADSNDIFLKGAVGFYDIESQKKLKVTDVIPLASATKSFTSVAVLLLQDKGLLHVDDPISKHLPQGSTVWPNGQMPTWANKVTIHHLLTHSSGIVDHVRRFKPDRKKSDMQLIKDVVAFAVSKPLEYEPGSKSTYSDTGFVLLGLIIENKTGKSLSEFLKKDVFEPLGMKNTYLASVSESFKVLDGKAGDTYPTGYFSTRDTEGGDHVRNSRLVKAAATINKNVVAYAGSAAASNVEDLIKWNNALHHGKILSKKSYDLMVTPYFNAAVDVGGNKDSLLGYGIYISKSPDGIIYYHHEGSSFGLRSDSGYIPAQDVSFALLSNIVHGRDFNKGEMIPKEPNPLMYMDIVDLRENIFTSISDKIDDSEEEEDGPHKDWDKSDSSTQMKSESSETGADDKKTK